MRRHSIALWSTMLTFLGVTYALPQERSLGESLLGTWSITTVYDVFDDGKKVNQWGDGVHGHYVFGADGSFTQVIIGEKRADLANDAFARPDAPVVAVVGRYTVDEGAKAVRLHTFRGSNSRRDNTDQVLTITLNGDQMSTVSSIRQTQDGRYSPHSEAKRFK